MTLRDASKALLDALAPGQVEALRRMAERNLRELPVPDRLLNEWDLTAAQVHAALVLAAHDPGPCWSAHRTEAQAGIINGRCAQVLVNCGLARRAHELGHGGLWISLTEAGRQLLLVTPSTPHPTTEAQPERKKR